MVQHQLRERLPVPAPQQNEHETMVLDRSCPLCVSLAGQIARPLDSAGEVSIDRQQGAIAPGGNDRVLDIPVASEISLIIFRLARFDLGEMRRFDNLELLVGYPFAGEFAARR